ncbi:MAG: glycine zipper family protein [Thermoanaerobaculia bacterium]
MTTKTNRIQAVVLSVALLLPAGGAFARTKHHRHHYSRTRGAAVGAVAGALIDHKKPLKGALIGAAAGNVVQEIRNHKQ